MEKYENMTLVEIKAELKKKKARLTGRKADLIQRLHFYNTNAEHCSSTGSSSSIVIASIRWPGEGFRQITPEHISVLPPLTDDAINGYFALRIAPDGVPNSDVQAMKKGRLVAEAKKIQALSLLIKEQHFWLTGICAAAMKKGVTYSLKLRIHRNGTVLNSSCECPSGGGDEGTCKHVAAALITLVKMRAENSMCYVNEGCTDTLQRFHKPKKTHTGSPVSLSSIPAAQSAALYDPRTLTEPPEVKRQRLHNLMVNYCHTTAHDINLRYMFPRANLTAAAADHDYLKLPFPQYWVLDSLKVNKAEANQIFEQTQAQTSCKRWFGERQWRLTASRFGEVIKVTERRDFQKLCENLTSMVQVNSPSLMHGKSYESAALKRYEEITGQTVTKCGLMISVDHPFLAATPDGMTKSKVIEIKCPYTGRDELIEPTENFKFLTKDMLLSKSHNYYAQVQGQMHITNKSICDLVVYTFKDIKIFQIQLDQQYINSTLLPKLKSFYHDILLPHIARSL